VAFFLQIIMATKKSENSEIPDKKNLYQIGYFPKLHGYKGELTAFLDTDDVKAYEVLEHIFVEIHGNLVPYFIELIEYKTNTTAKVKLEGIDNEEQAKGLLKCSIYIDPSQLSESDDNRQALRAIAGFKVFDSSKGLIGTVERIEEINNNPLMVINSGKKEILMPLNEDFIQEINTKKKEVHIEAPEGLIDFYLSQ
jgi:16S rRNA processing protein RimM